MENQDEGGRRQRSRGNRDVQRHGGGVGGHWSGSGSGLVSLSLSHFKEEQAAATLKMRRKALFLKEIVADLAKKGKSALSRRCSPSLTPSRRLGIDCGIGARIADDANLRIEIAY